MTIKLLVVRIVSFTFLVCPHYTGNRFSCRHENVSGSMNDNRIELEQVVHTYRTSYQSGRLAESSVWCTKSQSSLLTFTFISVAPSPRSPLLILLEKLFTLRQKVAEIYTICDDPFFKIGGGAVSFLNRNSRKITVFLYELTEAKSGIIFMSVQGLSDHSLQSFSYASY